MKNKMKSKRTRKNYNLKVMSKSDDLRNNREQNVLCCCLRQY